MTTTRTTLLIAAVSVLVPLQALAAFMSPSELIMALYNMNGPMRFSGEGHARVEQTYASLWISGTRQGSLKNASGTADVTFDIAMPEQHMTARVKGSMIVLDHMLYFKLISLDANMDHPALAMSGQMKGKQWVKVPLHDMEEEVMSDPDEAAKMFAMAADQMLRLEWHESYDGNDYGLWFKDIVDVPAGMSFKGVVHTDKNDVPVFANYMLGFEPTTEDMTLLLMGDTKYVSSIPAITAPAGAISLEEFEHMFEEQAPTDIFDAVSPSLPIEFFGKSWDDVPTHTHEEGTPKHSHDEEEMENDSSEPTTSDCDLTSQRKGLCGEKPTSRRTWTR